MTGAFGNGSAEEHPDLVARIAAATAMRRLAHALVGHQTDRSTLERIAEMTGQLADETELGDRRDRGEELSDSTRFAGALDGEALSRVVEDGAFVDLFHDSPVSGSANPLSMGLAIRRDGDHAVGTVTLEPGWEGAPGRSHGGIVAACVDETIGGLLPMLGTMAFTGHLALDYRAPCPLGVGLEFRAWLERSEGRKLHIGCTGTGPAGVFVECIALFIAVDLARLAGLNKPTPDTDREDIR